MDGATVTGYVSNEEDVAYLSFGGVAELERMNATKCGSLKNLGGAVVSVGTYTAEQLENGEVQFRGVNNYELLWVTVEPETGSENPSGAALVEMPLQES